MQKLIIETTDNDSPQSRVCPLGAQRGKLSETSMLWG